MQTTLQGVNPFSAWSPWFIATHISSYDIKIMLGCAYKVWCLHGSLSIEASNGIRNCMNNNSNHTTNIGYLYFAFKQKSPASINLRERNFI